MRGSVWGIRWLSLLRESGADAATIGANRRNRLMRATEQLPDGGYPLRFSFVLLGLIYIAIADFLSFFVAVGFGADLGRRQLERQLRFFWWQWGKCRQPAYGSWPTPCHMVVSLFITLGDGFCLTATTPSDAVRQIAGNHSPVSLSHRVAGILC